VTPSSNAQDASKLTKPLDFSNSAFVFDAAVDHNVRITFDKAWIRSFSILVVFVDAKMTLVWCCRCAII